MIVEAHPVTDPLTGFAPAPEGMQVDALVLQRAPQPFDEDVVEEPAPPVNGGVKLDQLGGVKPDHFL